MSRSFATLSTRPCLLSLLLFLFFFSRLLYALLSLSLDSSPSCILPLLLLFPLLGGVCVCPGSPSVQMERRARASTHTPLTRTGLSERDISKVFFSFCLRGGVFAAFRLSLSFPVLRASLFLLSRVEACESLLNGSFKNPHQQNLLWQVLPTSSCSPSLPACSLLPSSSSFLLDEQKDDTPDRRRTSRTEEGTTAHGERDEEEEDFPSFLRSLNGFFELPGRARKREKHQDRNLLFVHPPAPAFARLSSLEPLRHLRHPAAADLRRQRRRVGAVKETLGKTDAECTPHVESLVSPGKTATRRIMEERERGVTSSPSPRGEDSDEEGRDAQGQGAEERDANSQERQRETRKTTDLEKTFLPFSKTSPRISKYHREVLSSLSRLLLKVLTEETCKKLSEERTERRPRDSPAEEAIEGEPEVERKPRAKTNEKKKEIGLWRRVERIQVKSEVLVYPWFVDILLTTADI